MPAKQPGTQSGKPTTTTKAAAVSERKPWKKKTPVEIVLGQADKLRDEIAEAEEELKAKRRQLQKFEEARKIFEGS